MNIGVVGNGFVGGAVAHGLGAASSGSCVVRVHDKDKSASLNSLEETVNSSDFIFVCVPTPMNQDGSINLDVVRTVLKDIADVNKNLDNIVVLKSTVIPGTTELLQKEHPHLNLVFNPEFLTERTARLDFINQKRIVLGGDKKHTGRVAKLFKYRFKFAHIIETDFKTAELIKYFGNVFFAVKVSFANEIKLVCDKIGADWDTALEGFVADGRVADSHLAVPGPDGKMGFGGTCFPKDINAFIDFAAKEGVKLNTITGAWKTNLEVRPEKDWEKDKGRAVV